MQPSGLRTLRASRDARGRGAVRWLRGREDALAFGLLVQLAACLVAPALHLFDHRDDHQHLADGSIRRLTASPLAPAPAPAAPGWHDAGQLPVSHGVGAAQHFGVVLTAPAPAAVTVPVGFVPLPAIGWLDSHVLTGVPHGCARSRAPPPWGA